MLEGFITLLYITFQALGPIVALALLGMFISLYISFVRYFNAEARRELAKNTVLDK
jgi:hypothetical protein